VNARKYQASFAAGEISPSMTGRLDTKDYANGLLRARNVVIKPQGSLERRPGTGFVGFTKDSAAKKSRLLAFRYGSGQNLVIEMGAGYFRFWQNAQLIESSPGVAYEVANPYLESELFAVDYAQSYDVMSLAHPNHALRELRRLGPTSWTLTPATLTPTLAAPAGLTVTPRFGHLLAMSFPNGAILQLVTPGGVWTGGAGITHGLLAGDAVWASLNADGTGTFGGSIAPGNYIIAEVVVSDAVNPPRVKLAYTADGSLMTPTASTAGYIHRTSLSDAVESYKVTALHADRSESLPSAAVSRNNQLSVEGSYNTISWSAVTGAVRYRIYKDVGGVFGLIGETAALSIVDDNIEPDLGVTPPEADPVSYGNPSAVTYFEQRRFLAFQQDVIASRTGTDNDFTLRRPTQDTDRLSFRVRSRSSSITQFMLPMSQLVMLTDEGAYRLTPINDDAITPDSISVRPQSGIGARKVRPEIVNNVAVYVAARGSHLYELGWRSESQGYVSGDLSIRAPHLVDGFSITDLSLTRAPVQAPWLVRSDGKFLGLTYVPEEGVGAWHRHDITDGTVESTVTVSEGEEDVLYLLTRRVINGVADRRIERINAWTRTSDQSNWKFVDSHLRFDGRQLTTPTWTFTAGAPAGTLIGIYVTSSLAVFSALDVGKTLVVYSVDGRAHPFEIITYTSPTAVIAVMKRDSWDIVNATVSIRPDWALARTTYTGAGCLNDAVCYVLADGVPTGPIVPSGGSFTLPFAAVQVIIGIPYESEVVLLPAAFQADALAQGRSKSVDKTWLRVVDSGGFFIGPSPDKLVPVRGAFRAVAPVDVPPKVGPFTFSGEIETNVLPKTDQDGSIYISQSGPLPLEILGITMEVTLGG